MFDQDEEGAPSWQLEKEQVADAVEQITPALAGPLRFLSERVGCPVTVFGTLMSCAALAIDNGCSKEQFRQLVEETWDLMEAASLLTTSTDAKA